MNPPPLPERHWSITTPAQHRLEERARLAAQLRTGGHSFELIDELEATIKRASADALGMHVPPNIGRRMVAEAVLALLAERVESSL